MEIYLQSLLVGVFCGVFFLRYAWKILNWAWLRPKRLEKCLRDQGIRGSSYRLIYGDVKERSRMTQEAKSKPMTFSNDIANRVLPFEVKHINNHGKNSFFRLGPRPAMLIVDSELCKEILTKSYIYQKPTGSPLTKSLARGLADYETEKWAKHRRLLNPAFHQEKLKHMLPAFYTSCCEMLSKWEKMTSSEESVEVDVWPYLQTMTSDAISHTAFGSNYEEGRKVFERQKEQAELVTQAARSVYIPGWRFVPTKTNRRMMENVKVMNSSVRDIISKRLQAMEAGEVENDDLLGILLQSNYTEIQEHGNKSCGMSMGDIIEECKLFYFAGQETTALLLVWTMILLSKHLEWQAHAREEVLNVFSTKTPDFDELNHLKIVTMTLNEVLRLYPPGVMFQRMTTDETKLGKMSLPAGVVLMMPILLLHHDTEIWGDDAKEFNPERFREGVSKASKGQVSFFPFGWGPRICIGQTYAMLEAKMVLAMILQRFTFELSPSYSHAPITFITHQPQHGAQLRLRKL